MILETEHLTDSGCVRETDLMPWHAGGSAIIRIVKGLALTHLGLINTALVPSGPVIQRAGR